MPLRPPARPTAKSARAKVVRACLPDPPKKSRDAKAEGKLARKKTIATMMVYTTTAAKRRPAGSAPAKAASKSRPLKTTVKKTASKAASKPASKPAHKTARKPASMASKRKPATARESTAIVPRRRGRCVTHSQLVSQIGNLIGRELDLIDAITATVELDDRKHSEGERRARMIATLARVMAELKKQLGDQARPADDDDRPRNLDELRERLSRRLAERVDGGAQRADRGDEPG